jgi:tetratricopeptide (TPR) repeat protein
MTLLSFLHHRGQKRAKKLYDSAREMLKEERYEDALEVARKLRKLSDSGAYDIEGLAYFELDRNEDAVRVLREGLAIEPGIWFNWHLLGNCLSNLGQFDDAMQAYERAEGCADADRSLIELNRAIVAMRQNAYISVLAHLNRIESYESEESRWRAISLRVNALHALGRDREAEQLGSKTLGEWNGEDGKFDMGRIAFLLGEIAMARGDDREKLRAYAIDWFRRTHCQDLLWMIRELRPRTSPNAQYFWLVLQGTIKPGSAFEREVDAKGFFTMTEVVADSAEEAMALYLELLPQPDGVTLEIGERTQCEPQPDYPIGVYSTKFGRVYYAESE